ncbi:sugar transferase [Rubellicoccus peritrichatus]|uniref:Sugar transferase n=1 Tax=Rubellicoccus peritrichatus TaxID=3080537 RepID=A0AAQ3LDP9_9BACT|nr:sugar transferase [Puniceicoccus sp. CR14]WOO42667.1 sugar transferase [Puniceicoccus sp. CR14]
MLGRQKRRYKNISFAADVLAALLILEAIYLLLFYASPQVEPVLRHLTGYPFNLQGVEHLTDAGWLFAVILLCLFLGLHTTRFYSIDLFAGMRRVFLGAFKGVLLGLGLVTLFFYVFSIINVNRSLLFGFFISFFAYQVTKEFIYRKFLLQRRLKRRPLTALVVAPVQEKEAIEQQFAADECSTVSLGGFLEKTEDLARELSRQSFDLVILGDHEHPQQVIELAEEQGVEVWYFADFISPLLSRPQFDEFGGRPVVVFSTIPHYEGKFLLKRLVDVFGSMALLVLFSPLLILCAIAIRLESKGTVLFRQSRTGWRGRAFPMVKFRTMANGAENQRAVLSESNEHEGPVFKARNDPRVTRVGAFLRRYSLDELPQLWNVLKGDMSLVGPRPLPVDETLRFERFRDRRRLSVLPGLTGLWQVSGRSDIRDFAEWVRLDLEYIDQWSLWLDLRILLKTIPVVLSGQGAR